MKLSLKQVHQGLQDKFILNHAWHMELLPKLVTEVESNHYLKTDVAAHNVTNIKIT